MPGAFYVENKAEKVSLAAIELSLTDLQARIDTIKSQTDKLAGQIPGEGSTTADWQLAEVNVVSIGTVGTRYKIHDLTISIHNLVGNTIIVRLYKAVNGVERKIYEQDFNAGIDPPGLPVINGSWAIHGELRATVQSNDPGDNGKAVDYDYLLEAM